MKKYLVLIPLAVFTLSVLIASITSVVLTSSAKRVLSTANQNDWPVVALWLPGHRDGYGIYTLDGPGAFVPAPRWRNSNSNAMYFSEDGNLYASGRCLSGILEYELPDYRPRIVDISIPGLPFDIAGYINLVSNQGSIRLSMSDLDQTGPDYLYHLSQFDLETGNYIHSGLFSEIPGGPETVSQESFFISDYGIYMLSRARHDPDPADDWDRSDYILYRYDPDVDIYNIVYTVEKSWSNDPEIYYGPDAGVIGVSTRLDKMSDPMVTFIDGVSGEVLQSIIKATTPYVGDRWAACAGTTDASIILFDMDDNWKKYRIKSDDQPRKLRFFTPRTIALCEFPVTSE